MLRVPINRHKSLQCQQLQHYSTPCKETLPQAASQVPLHYHHGYIDLLICLKVFIVKFVNMYLKEAQVLVTLWKLLLAIWFLDFLHNTYIFPVSCMCKWTNFYPFISHTAREKFLHQRGCPSCISAKFQSKWKIITEFEQSCPLSSLLPSFFLHWWYQMDIARLAG